MDEWIAGQNVLSKVALDMSSTDGRSKKHVGVDRILCDGRVIFDHGVDVRLRLLVQVIGAHTKLWIKLTQSILSRTWSMETHIYSPVPLLLTSADYLV